MRMDHVAPGRLRVNDIRAGSDDYVFNDRYARAWRGPARDLVLARCTPRSSTSAPPAA